MICIQPVVGAALVEEGAGLVPLLIQRVTGRQRRPRAAYWLFCGNARQQFSSTSSNFSVSLVGSNWAWFSQLLLIAEFDLHVHGAGDAGRSCVAAWTAFCSRRCKTEKAACGVRSSGGSTCEWLTLPRCEGRSGSSSPRSRGMDPLALRCCPRRVAVPPCRRRTGRAPS